MVLHILIFTVGPGKNKTLYLYFVSHVNEKHFKDRLVQVTMLIPSLNVSRSTFARRTAKGG